MRIAFGEFVLDTDRFELHRNGEPVALRRQALDVLLHLIEARDRLVTREELVAKIWGEHAISETALGQAIAAVRRALGEVGDESRFVHTVRGRGYRFVAPVRFEDAPARPEAAPRGAFVGRAQEMAQLRGLMDRAESGEGGVTWLSGPSGAGRTRTALQLASVGRDSGWRVAAVHCDEESAATDLWPWRRLVRDLLQDEGLREEVGGEVAAGLLERVAGMPVHPGERSSGQDMAFGIFDEVAQLLRAAGRPRGLLAVIDDVHFADDASLVLFKFAARALAGARVLVLATYREADLAKRAPLARVFGAVMRQDPARHVRLPPLARDEVASVARASLGAAIDEAVLERLVTKTAGNVLLLNQVLHAMASDGTSASTSVLLSVDEMREAIDLNLGHLSEPCREILGAAAVLGTEFTVLSLAALVERSATSVLQDLDEAIRTRVLALEKGAAGRARFVHPLVRDALYGKLSAARRAALHERAALVLDEAGDLSSTR